MADSAYNRKNLIDKAGFLDFTVKVVLRTDTEPGFEILLRHWVIEQTFGWMTRWRRLVRNYEALIDVSGGMIHAHHSESSSYNHNTEAAFKQKLEEIR